MMTWKSPALLDDWTLTNAMPPGFKNNYLQDQPAHNHAVRAVQVVDPPTLSFKQMTVTFMGAGHLLQLL
jgi:hypothetical protein